ncbi:Heavy metal-associated domain, HMA [Sesbania bispinosa]|nr:Heavy metal-associated domain, HMA [Sesbania bispinosa]
MVRESQIQVRVDCNGCVQKIKKALNGIDGIHDLRVDLHRQKLTIIGWADPEKVVKAIKKTRKNAIICSNIELPSPSKPTEPEPKGMDQHLMQHNHHQQKLHQLKQAPHQNHRMKQHHHPHLHSTMQDSSGRTTQEQKVKDRFI